MGTKEIAERDGLPSNHQLKNFIDERREVSPDLPDLDLVTLQLILEWRGRQVASFTCSTTGCESGLTESGLTGKCYDHDVDESDDSAATTPTVISDYFSS